MIAFPRRSAAPVVPQAVLPAGRRLAQVVGFGLCSRAVLLAELRELSLHVERQPASYSVARSCGAVLGAWLNILVSCRCLG